MADSRGFKPINQLWQSATVPTDQDSECLYEEIPGLSGSQDTDQPAGAAVGHAVQEEEEEEEEEDENVGGSRGSLDFGVQVGGSGDWWGDQSGGREDIVAGGGTVPRSRIVGRNGQSRSGSGSGASSGARSRSGSADRRRPSDRARQQDIVVVGRVEEERYAARRIHVEPGTGAVLPPSAATGLKLTRGRPTSQSTVARYLHSASTNASATHHHHHHHGLHGQYPPASGARTTGRQHRHHHSSRGAFSNETQEEEDDEATLRELLVRYVRTIRANDQSLSRSLGFPSSPRVGVHHFTSRKLSRLSGLSRQLPRYTLYAKRKSCCPSFVDVSVGLS